MDQGNRKKVKVSLQFETDIRTLYAYGEEVFGSIAAKKELYC